MTRRATAFGSSAPSRRAAVALSLGAAFGAGITRPAAAQDAPPSAPPPVVCPETDLEAALERTAPAIVSVQLLVKYEGGVESTSWSHGAVVDPTGIVMMSGSEIGGPEGKLSDAKVLFGNDPKEWSAVLVARDTALDLAYLQVLGVGDKPLAAVSLAGAKDARKGEPRLGEPLYGVTRMGRGFDYAPSVRKVYFVCRIESPRRMWDIAGGVDAGLPVFDMAGNPVAVLANQASAEGADENGGSSVELFALPLEPVIRSLEQARKRVPDAVKKAEASKKEAADTTKEAARGGETPKPPMPPPGAPTPPPSEPSPSPTPSPTPDVPKPPR